MLKRGARKFAFLGLTGIAKESSRLLVEELRRATAHVTVISGNVGHYSVVERAVNEIEGSIGGVIQAAMGLDASFQPFEKAP